MVAMAFPGGRAGALVLIAVGCSNAASPPALTADAAQQAITPVIGPKGERTLTVVPVTATQRGFVFIDVARCTPDLASASNEYAHYHFAVAGKSGGACVFDYGGEIDGHAKNLVLDQHCQVPVDVGLVALETFDFHSPNDWALRGFCEARRAPAPFR